MAQNITVQGRVKEAGSIGRSDGSWKGWNVTIYTDDGQEIKATSGQDRFNHQPTIDLLRTGIAEGQRVELTYSVNGQYTNLISVKLLEDAHEQPIEGSLQASSLMMGGKDALIVDQVLLKAAVELMNGPRDMNKEEATETVIGLWDQIRSRHIPKVEEETGDESGS
tara:strand:- start:306 stop:803 length:498 start_codon:yes stop_codon:yes gene_type:complete